MAESSGKIEWFIQDGEREIGPLAEMELRKRLRRARRDKLRVRQNDGPWYPAKEVVRKFRELAENGIYIKLGSVAGPYTAQKAYALLQNLNLDGVQAKIGLHGNWVSAGHLLAKLQKAIDKAAGVAKETVTVQPGVTLVDIERQDELVPLDPIVDGDDGEADPFDLTSSAAIPLVKPLEEIDSMAALEPIWVEPIAEEVMPVVEPLAEDSIPLVQPLEQIPVVEPIEVHPVPQPPVRQLTHWCACGREVRVMPQHAGMTMQCPACKRVFVAGGR